MNNFSSSLLKFCFNSKIRNVLYFIHSSKQHRPNFPLHTRRLLAAPLLAYGLNSGDFFSGCLSVCHDFHRLYKFKVKLGPSSTPTARAASLIIRSLPILWHTQSFRSGEYRFTAFFFLLLHNSEMCFFLLWKLILYLLTHTNTRSRVLRFFTPLDEFPFFLFLL